MNHYCLLHCSLQPSQFTSTTVVVTVADVTLQIGMATSNTGTRDIGNIFNFRSNSRDLVVLDGTALDRETIDQYNFTIVATDATDLTSTATVTINILDVNDNTPVITNDM